MTVDLFSNEGADELGLAVKDGRVVVSSRTVAQVFGKRPDSVLRDIRNVECSEDFRLHNFVESSYLNEQNRKMPEYLLTRDGFTLLAMGYTGEKATAFKERYIQAFNAMEAELARSGGLDAAREALDSFNIPKDYLSALKLAVCLEERRQELEGKVAELEPKARYHDNVLNSDGLYNATQISKDYGMSAKAFNKLLAGMGIQYQFKRGGQWFLYAKWQDKGYAKSVTVPLGNGKSASQTKWTESGRAFLYNELAKRGLYPTESGMSEE